MRTGKAHSVRITPGSWLHRVAGATEIAVNSLHNQGIDRLGDILVPDAVAPDGTVEAIHARSPGFAVGVQWHPEYDWDHDAVSRRIFEVFGQAVRDHAVGAVAAAD